MTFKPELIPEVFNGNKRVTRRSANARYKPGDECAIQPGMGRESMGRMRVLKVTVEELGMVDDAEAKLEGFKGIQDFIEYWIQLHKSWDPSTKVKRIQFEVIEQTHKLCPTCNGPGVLPTGVTL